MNFWMHGCKPKSLGGMIALLVLSACTLAPEQLTVPELEAAANSDTGTMFDHVDAVTGPISLSEALARAFKFNLDHKVKAMEEALSLNQSDLDKFALLPGLRATTAYSDRSQFIATNSKDVDGATPSGAYSYSADRSSITGDLTMSWNILDFGVSYYSARQNADRSLVAGERRRKILHSLAKEVQSTFWRVVAAQELKGRVSAGIKNAEAALRDAEKVEQEKLRAPEETLRHQKRLIENMRVLETINQQLSTARFELAALINLPPSKDFQVVPPLDNALMVPEWTVPVPAMEALAFQNNPDLREHIYLNRIAANQTKKALVALLPGIDLTGGRKYDGNSFLDANRWYGWSAALSWNVLNVFKLPTQQKFSAANEKLSKTKRLALRMAVMAQVHVANRQYHNAIRQFRQADKLYNIEKRLADLFTIREATDAESQFDLIAQETSAISSELRRYQTYAEVISTLGRIHATLGISIVDDQKPASDIKSLSEAVAKAMGEWRSGRAIKRAVSEMAALYLDKSRIFEPGDRHRFFAAENNHLFVAPGDRHGAPMLVKTMRPVRRRPIPRTSRTPISLISPGSSPMP